MRDLFRAAVFYNLNVLLFPVTLIGYVTWVGKAMRTGRGSGVSHPGPSGAGSWSARSIRMTT